MSEAGRQERLVTYRAVRVIEEILKSIVWLRERLLKDPRKSRRRGMIVIPLRIELPQRRVDRICQRRVRFSIVERICRRRRISVITRKSPPHDNRAAHLWSHRPNHALGGS